MKVWMHRNEVKKWETACKIWLATYAIGSVAFKPKKKKIRPYKYGQEVPDKK